MPSVLGDLLHHQYLDLTGLACFGLLLSRECVRALWAV